MRTGERAARHAAPSPECLVVLRLAVPVGGFLVPARVSGFGGRLGRVVLLPVPIRHLSAVGLLDSSGLVLLRSGAAVAVTGGLLLGRALVSRRLGARRRALGRSEGGAPDMKGR